MVRNIEMELTDKIIAAMKEAATPMSAGQVTEMIGVERKDVDKAFKVLKKEERIISPVHCKWAPAE